MNNDYLHQLIDEVQQRDGGILLNVAGKTEAVVLSIDRYNQLLVNKPGNGSKPKSVLLTGGAGYVGAHVARQLIQAGHRVTIIDDLSTGNLANVPELAVFLKVDIRDVETVRQILIDNEIELVLHLAGSSDADESLLKPVEYLHNNVIGTAALLQAMSATEVKTIIFSSSSAVYGHPLTLPVPEFAPTLPINPFGSGKLLSEQLIQYYCQYKGFQAVVFRYCNASGSDFDGTINDPHTDQLIPAIKQVLIGKQDTVTIFGNDYDTFDGTCVRDYLHVSDIARAHLLALDNLPELGAFTVYNIGAGHGHSVENVLQTATEITGKMIPLEIGPRKDGEVAAIVLDTTKIKAELGFEPLHSDLKSIIETGVRVTAYK